MIWEPYYHEQPNRDIELSPSAVEEAKVLIGNDPEAAERLHSVSQMIEGFETLYGIALRYGAAIDYSLTAEKT